MKLVFVSSPLRGNLKENIERAKKLCHWVTKKGYVAFAPHLLFTQFLDDNSSEERQLGIESGLEMLKRCDEVWVFHHDCQVSAGMFQEIEFAKKLGIKIKLFEIDDVLREENK